MRILLIYIYVLVLVRSSLELRNLPCTTPKIQNGRAKYRQKSRFVKYFCNTGFLLSGDKYSTCLHGKLDGPIPKCVRPGCRKVNPPNNGFIFPSHMNAVLNFFCKPGFELRGPSVTHCNSSTWSYNSPICLKTNSKPALSCDFEKADLCGWTHDLNHDFDWRRMQFSTPTGSIGTGPSFDHTYGEDKGGYYMYIESSARSENDTAKLISPVYDKTINNTCFQFFYHMYGTTIGSLRVYLKMVNESSELDVSKAFFEKRGNQGNRWLEYLHMFGPIPKDFQIIIEGTRGIGYVSDIAIDDVRLIENCTIEDMQKLEITSTTEDEYYGTTDFLPDDLYSCENRCFTLNIAMGKHRKCACDENCYDRNECCPDFIDICILHGGSSMDSEYISSSTIISTTSTTTAKPLNTPTKTTTTEKPKEKTTQQTTTKKSVVMTTTKDKYPLEFTFHIHPKPKVTTDKISTTRKFKERVKTTQFKSTRTTRETPTTPRTTKIRSTITSAITTEHNKRDESTIRMGWKQKSKTTDIYNDIMKIPKDMVPLEDVAHLKRNFNEKIVIFQSKEDNNLPLYLGCGGVVLVISALVLVIIKKRNSFRSRGFRSASRGDSTSDVRFLTSDEFLDLNLDYK
ncbi:hypothetical protein WA026_016802 [Henosepilachna vigintioctopunctata]|uniref:Uncharacterized protein n=1 Tax=Henosepilachna vigintioctopunctata TaxID=420089 RepID=A0AAW1UVK7_9CUCU